MKKIYIPLFIVGILYISGCKEERISEHSHYDLDLSFDPVEQFLNVEGQMNIPVMNDTTHQIEFYLHRQLDIIDLRLNGKRNFDLHKDPSEIRYMPEATRYVLITPGTIKKEVALSFQYSGVISEWPEWSASVIGEEWTEMSCYFPWYPSHKQFRPFTYEVDIRTVKDYRYFVMGQKKESKDMISFISPFPTNDIVVCASKELKAVNRKLDDFTFQLAYTTLSDTLIDTLSADVDDILTTFNQWFPGNESSICLVESMREKGGAYARTGGMYLSGFNKTSYFESRKGYMRYLSHEISHLWWYRASSNSWEDWLNEGFAEYSALMIIRDKYGQDYFLDWIEKKKQEMEDTGPIWECDRNGRDAYAILYSKAPVLLHQLEQKTGKNEFKELMRLMLEKEVSDTEQFLHLLGEQQGRDKREWFKALLMEA